MTTTATGKNKHFMDNVQDADRIKGDMALIIDPAKELAQTLKLGVDTEDIMFRVELAQHAKKLADQISKAMAETIQRAG